MARILRNLRIESVDSVDRGAGEKCTVMLAKQFNPDQPRDEHGRWTGGSTDDVVSALHAAGTDRSKFDRAMEHVAGLQMKDLNEVARQYAKYPGNYKTKGDAIKDINAMFIRRARFENKLSRFDDEVVKLGGHALPRERADEQEPAKAPVAAAAAKFYECRECGSLMKGPTAICANCGADIGDEDEFGKSKGDDDMAREYTAEQIGKAQKQSFASIMKSFREESGASHKDCNELLAGRQPISSVAAYEAMSEIGKSHQAELEMRMRRAGNLL